MEAINSAIFFFDFREKKKEVDHTRKADEAVSSIPQLQERIEQLNQDKEREESKLEELYDEMKVLFLSHSLICNFTISQFKKF